MGHGFTVNVEKDRESILEVERQEMPKERHNRREKREREGARSETREREREREQRGEEERRFDFLSGFGSGDSFGRFGSANLIGSGWA